MTKYNTLYYESSVAECQLQPELKIGHQRRPRQASVHVLCTVSKHAYFSAKVKISLAIGHTTRISSKSLALLFPQGWEIGN